MSQDYEIFYPGVYTAEEQEALDRLKAQFEEIEKNAAAFAFDPETAAFTDRADPFQMAVYAHAWDPFNPLFNDAEYAKNTVYGDVIAIPGLYEPMGGFASVPHVMGDLMGGPGLDHDLFCCRPVKAGDRLFTMPVKLTIKDVTGESGSEIRAFRVTGENNMYNQRGELVCKSVNRATECFERATDPAKRKVRMGGHDDWSKLRPIHRYTESDWAYIRELWSREYVRGADTLYWEDVRIGDEPVWTCDGPITAMDMTLRHGIESAHFPSIRGMMSSPGGLPPIVTPDPYGIYHPPGALHFENQNMPHARATFYNHTGRNLTIRLLTNWMGDAGFLRRISWHIISQFMEPFENGRLAPDPERPGYLYLVPYLKGKTVNSHGMTGDLGISKGCVVEKYIKDGEHLVDLVVWCEDIEGNIFSEGYGTVRLPSRDN